MQYISVEDLKKNPNNPRIIKKGQYQKLKESLSGERGKEFFEARPCIVSNRTGANIIIAGNTRFQASVDLGWTEVPAKIIGGLTEAHEREIIIRDNVSNGTFDWDILANEWDTDELESWGVDLPVSFEDIDVNKEEPEIEICSQCGAKRKIT